MQGCANLRKAMQNLQGYTKLCKIMQGYMHGLCKGIHFSEDRFGHVRGRGIATKVYRQTTPLVDHVV